MKPEKTMESETILEENTPKAKIPVTNKQIEYIYGIKTPNDP